MSSFKMSLNLLRTHNPLSMKETNFSLVFTLKLSVKSISTSMIFLGVHNSKTKILKFWGKLQLEKEEVDFFQILNYAYCWISNFKTVRISFIAGRLNFWNYPA